MKISIFGCGYVGLTTGACLANLGHEVLCIDIDENKILQLKEGIIHFYEPGLKDIVSSNLSKGRLRFSTNIEEGVNFSRVIFNCVGTPSMENGSANLEFVFNVAREVAKFSDGFKILVNKSTVPPGTARKCQELINQTSPGSKVEVVSNPEFLKEGNAVHDFTHPDKIVIGANSLESYQLLRKVYSGLVRPYMNLLETNWETSEMIKYANNSFLATKISFINEIANICDGVGADVKLVSQGLGMDYRISPKFLNAGMGYGGSCFPKDVKALINTAARNNYQAKLLKEVDELNKRQKTILWDKIVKRFGGDLRGKTITVWGLSFKPKTSDIRDAPSLILINLLLQAGAKVNVYDPVATKEVKQLYGEKLNYFNFIHESVKNSSAAVLVTEWDEFRNIKFSDLEMQEKIIFDGRNIYNPKLLREEGFEYHGVGRG